MSFLGAGANDGVTSASSPQTVVPAPTSGVQRIIKSITVYNPEVAQVTITFNYVSAGGTRARIFLMDSGDFWEFESDDMEVLDATTKSITISSTSDNCVFTASWADNG